MKHLTKQFLGLFLAVWLVMGLVASLTTLVMLQVKFGMWMWRDVLA